MPRASPRQLHFGADSCEIHTSGVDTEKTYSWRGSSDGTAFSATSHHWRLGHHGDKLRSDAYLRQALTSPFNQREKHISTASSPGQHHGSANVPLEFHHFHHDVVPDGVSRGSPHHSKQQGALSEFSPRHHHNGTGSGVEHESVFKTPHRVTVDQLRRDRHHSHHALSHSAGASGNCSSPMSSSSSGSGGRRHFHHNPFEGSHDRLHFPVFSPGMFHAASTPASTESGSFRWDPEHLAELRPVQIDEKDIKRQLTRRSPDDELEDKAQRAIDYYFAHHMVAPSPWGEDPPPHVLPVTPAYSKGYSGSTPNETHGSIQKELTRSRKSRDASCQTTLTLPVDFDIHKILGEYMTHQETEEGGGESMSTSSLRRKLFFNADSSSIFSPVKTGKESPDHVSAALLSPPPFTPSRKTTPEWERTSPIHTPSSVQFSSSPIRGPYYGDGEYRRCSFSESGALASPELSPIAQRQKDESRPVMRRLSSMDSDDADEHGDDADPSFGTGVRQQLQMEVHSGSSPPPSRPSPNMSPIAFSGTDTSQASRSHTLRAEPSPTSSSRNQSHEKGQTSGSSRLPMPFSSHSASATATHNGCVSMDTDPFTASDSHGRQGQSTSARDTSMTDVCDGEGGSGLDMLHHPNSLSNQDTGYQTASVSGSLQTTQHDGILHHMSNDTGIPSTHLDASALSASTETRQHSKSEESNTQSGGRESAVRFTGLNFSAHTCLSENQAQLQSCVSVDSPLQVGADMKETVMAEDNDAGPPQRSESDHTNLTEQFLSMPFQPELGVEGAVFEGDVHPAVEGPTVAQSPAEWLQDKSTLKPSKSAQQVSKDQTFTVTKPGSVGASVEPSNDFGNGGIIIRKTASQKPSQLPSGGGFNEEDIAFLIQDEKLYSQDAQFLEKVAHYLETDTTQLDADTSDRHVHLNTPNFVRDDSLLERARNYLAAGGDFNCAATETSHTVTREKMSPPGVATPLSSLTASTPVRRMLGKVVEDLTTSRGVSGDRSPALASEVAKEILRRAEEDLHRFQTVRSGDVSH